MAPRKQWTKAKAIKDLMEIKDSCLRAMNKEAVTGDGEIAFFCDSKMASGALSAIKELNSISGIGDSKNEADKELNVNIKVIGE